MNSESEGVLKALASSTRRTIMRQISEKGTATYTEIMQVLGLDPSLMSGKFNYHLKELSEAGLIERTDGEYRITDLGKRALILVDQVAKEAKVDQYGVLSAVMSMSPKKELELFFSQMGMMFGFMCTILSLIPFLINYGTGSIVYWISLVGLVTFLTVAVVSTAKMVSILAKFKLGFSVMVFLSTNWFFIRSRNRNSFFAITGLLALTIVSLALSLLLPYTGELLLFSLEWLILLLCGTTMATLTIGLSLRAKRRADRLEAVDSVK